MRFHVHQWYSNKTLIGTTKFDRGQSGPINLTSRPLKLLHTGKAKKKATFLEYFGKILKNKIGITNYNRLSAHKHGILSGY